MLYRSLLALLPLICAVPAAAGDTRLLPECQAIGGILANKEHCHGRTVRLSGKVAGITRTGKYTRFYLTEDSKALKFFNYGDAFGDLPVKEGGCFVVEGTYYYWRTVVSSAVFQDEVRWANVMPCASALAPTTRTDKQPRGDTRRKARPIHWIWYVLGGALLVVLAGAVSRHLRQRRYRRLGKEFEDYVAGLFGEQEWMIEDRSSDTAYKMGRRITGDLAYDWIVRHRRTGRRFIVQCKYRSRFYRDGIEVAKPFQLRHYRDYQRAKAWDYVVVLGVGGTPKAPEQLYLIPLERIRDTVLWRRELLPYARDPRTAFTLANDGRLR